jgi:putative Mg2+ transporter-C (MgtC) family protein
MSWNDLVIALRLDLLVRLIVAAVLGSAIGMEREIQGKSAGLRTNSLICVGACLFTELSIALTGPGTGDPSRVAAQIVTGVGFIGAGTIMRGRGAVTGLTTAATIWLVAAVGMAVGAGWTMEAAGATLLTLVVLSLLGRMEAHLAFKSGSSEVRLRLKADERYLERIEEMVGESGAKVEKLDTTVTGDEMTVRLKMRGVRHARDKAKLKVMRATGIWSVTDLDREAGGTTPPPGGER